VRVLKSSFQAALWLAGLSAGACAERGDRYYSTEEAALSCPLGSQRCRGTLLEHCSADGRTTAWQTDVDCAASQQVCAPTLLTCTSCVPGTLRCSGQSVTICDPDGSAFSPKENCDPEAGEACRDGGCANLCQAAARHRSNVGCEYWAVDLDNARVSEALNAAAQQFAIVISNPQPDVPARVVIEQDDAAPGEPNLATEVARDTVPPFSLRVYKLGPREVDGSAPGTFDTGSGTALSRNAYRVRSSVPIVAYQFNPLENVNVFSNDASLLKPVEAVTPTTADFADAYVVSGWPQTIAITDDPRTNFSSDSPSNLRAFLTLVGTRANTRVRVTTSTAVIPGGPVAATKAGGTIEAELGPFDVLNLETGDFNADFSGSIIASNGPVIVFSGSEASDAPPFSDLSDRQCCADHLEEQLDPIRTGGRSFIATVSPNRAAAVVAAGAKLDVLDQPEYYRVIAATDKGARITTTLGGDLARFELPAKASFVDLPTTAHFALQSDAPVMLTSVSPSQEAANIPRGLPGGDPSLVVMPPIEQFRSSYVFLTPDKYSFDFVRIVAPLNTSIVFDGEPLEALEGCLSAAIPLPTDATVEPGSVFEMATQWVVYRCQLSFPRIDPDRAAPNNLSPGLQNDGVHRITASAPIGVLVDGFDSFVSYAYAAGTELEFIVTQ
jgi:hypothetical protein